MNIPKPRSMLVAWNDVILVSDGAPPPNPQLLTRDDWPTVWLPDRQEPGEYREHTVRRKMGF